MLILIICLLILLICIFCICKNNKENLINPSSYGEVTCNNQTPVDIVITWVEINSEFEKEKSYWIKKDNINYIPSETKYKDNQELKYCLRSIDKYFPNYNKIYLVVKDNQFPFYININSPHLIVVKHSDILPLDALPTFNSRAIEACIHKINGLSEYYLYFNDDFFLHSPTNKRYFIDSNGVPYNLVTKDKKKTMSKDLNRQFNLDNYDWDEGYYYNNTLLNNILDENRYGVSHVPKMYRKSFDEEIEKMFGDMYVNTIYSKFRKNDNLYLVAILKHYLYMYLFNGQIKQTTSINIDFNTSSNDYIKEKDLNNDKIKFLCVQEVITDQQKYYEKIMNDLFPTKSKFEL